MITNIEQTLLDKFRQLSQQKQQDVLQFLNLIQPDINPKTTNEELSQAKEILMRAKNRALSTPQKSAQQLWSEFNEIKNDIAQQYGQDLE
jgi:hypothetical protein